MRHLLITRFGFQEADICLLVDDGKQTRPTWEVIREHLLRLIGDVKAGDVLVFHFSGHGVRLPPEGEPDETGYQEGILTADYNFITDHDFRFLVEKIPDGVMFTFIADSCYSGGLIQHLEERIGSGQHPGMSANPCQPQQNWSNLENSTGSGYQQLHGPQPIGRWLDEEHWQVPGLRADLEHGHFQNSNASSSVYAEGSHGINLPGTSYEPQGFLERHRMHRRSCPQALLHHSGHTTEEEGLFSWKSDGHTNWKNLHDHSGYPLPHLSQKDCEGSYVNKVVNKSLPPDMLATMLSKGAQRQVQIGNIRTNLYDMFKEHSSITVKSFVNSILSRLKEEGSEDKMLHTTGSDLAAQFLKHRLEDVNYNEYVRPAMGYSPSQTLATAAFHNKCILISACSSNESAGQTTQVYPSCGILSYAIQTILSEHKGPIDNFQLVVAVRNLVKKLNPEQHPCLYCDDKNATSVFICY